MSKSKDISREDLERMVLEKMARIVVLDQSKVAPNMPAFDYLRKNCNLCARSCIRINDGDPPKPEILEDACPVCLNCAKRCPGGAVRIVNVPHSLAPKVFHRYGPNAFKLHRLPMPRTNSVLGLVGTNGIGKSTALKILAGQLKPNLGRVGAGGAAEWEDVLAHCRGSELQGYFTKLLDNSMTAATKLQYVDMLPQHIGRWVVGEVLEKMDSRRARAEVVASLALEPVLQRRIEQLSGGELQRVALAIVLVQTADVYLFDEPSSYLDVVQRLRAARAIRGLLGPQTYVVAVEHDLSVLDYLSDVTCLLYGVRGAYGVAAAPLGSREGINAFLSGFLPTENLRFRKDGLNFKPTAEALTPAEEEARRKAQTETRYPAMRKRLGSFSLKVEAGSFTSGEIVVLLGENGMGKTLLVRMLAGQLKPDALGDGGGGEGGSPLPQLQCSYKPQRLSPRYPGTVRELLQKSIGDALVHPLFAAKVLAPLKVDALLEHSVKSLSGGELQICALAIALGTPADVYLIDEPSAYLDSEQRIAAARVLKHFVTTTQKTALVVEHDFMMATYLADRVLVYTGTPAVDALATAPQPLQSGMNQFLRGLDVTFRRDPESSRPRINKLDSVVDKQQKASGNFFFLDS